MQVPLQITLRNIDPTPAIEDRIHKKADKLSQYSDQIISCHIVVELPKRHQHQGKLNNVRINLTLPGKEFAVNRNEVEDLYVAIRDAFDDMARKVEEEMRMRMGHVKTHPELLQGEIVRLFKEKDFGFIATPDGEEFYFNAGNVVHPTFEKLEVGTTVQFIEAIGDDGAQAHRVSAKER
ncbi:HPF/RaiA family ribosome-associated protein [Coxiella burnetii]|uniref:HPF/RaiA family ribosome-associated protein n=1 Tax=Coxiella burnetii TaxID=777 RepID=UPI0022316107|nr:HPF/RaiA family ribosome-associated protein [Coxiella burnetii]